MLILKKFDALVKVADGNATKLVVPNKFASGESELIMTGEFLEIKTEGSRKTRDATSVSKDICCK